MKDSKEYTKEELDNHSNQLNPNDDAYWQSRGYNEKPDDWKTRVDKDDDNKGKNDDKRKK